MRQTKGQTQRIARPDADRFNKLYLIKQVTFLRATYQIRFLASKAQSDGTKLIIRVPRSCRFSDALEELIRTSAKAVFREDY